MKRAFIAALAALGVVVAGLAVAQSLGLSPLSPAPPPTRVYVAISRSDDETDAREIEVIDTASGERDLFAVNGHITALDVARDRRTLFVGTSDGRVLFLNPSTGRVYRTIELRRPVFHLLALSDASRLAIVTSGAFSLWDVGAFREIGTVSLDGSPIGRPAEGAARIFIPVAEAASSTNALVVVRFDPLSSSRRRSCASRPSGAVRRSACRRSPSTSRDKSSTSRSTTASPAACACGSVRSARRPRASWS